MKPAKSYPKPDHKPAKPALPIVSPIVFKEVLNSVLLFTHNGISYLSKDGNLWRATTKSPATLAGLDETTYKSRTTPCARLPAVTVIMTQECLDLMAGRRHQPKITLKEADEPYDFKAHAREDRFQTKFNEPMDKPT